MLLSALFLLSVPHADSASLDHWRALIVPPPSECAFESIGWKAAMWPAVVEAQREDKPVLLWAMNGNPLACT
jgi:hypothetical protein